MQIWVGSLFDLVIRNTYTETGINGRKSQANKGISVCRYSPPSLYCCNLSVYSQAKESNHVNISLTRSCLVLYAENIQVIIATIIHDHDKFHDFTKVFVLV